MSQANLRHFMETTACDACGRQALWNSSVVSLLLHLIIASQLCKSENAKPSTAFCWFTLFSDFTGFTPYSGPVQLAPRENGTEKSTHVFFITLFTVFTHRSTFSFINLKQSCIQMTSYWWLVTVIPKRPETSTEWCQAWRSLVFSGDEPGYLGGTTPLCVKMSLLYL